MTEHPKIGDVYKNTEQHEAYFLTLEKETEGITRTLRDDEAEGCMYGIVFVVESPEVHRQIKHFKLFWYSREDVPLYELVGNIKDLKLTDVIMVINDES